jgi:hypothetical protein
VIYITMSLELSSGEWRRPADLSPTGTFCTCCNGKSRCRRVCGQFANPEWPMPLQGRAVCFTTKPLNLPLSDNPVFQ